MRFIGFALLVSGCETFPGLPPSHHPWSGLSYRTTEHGCELAVTFGPADPNADRYLNVTCREETCSCAWWPDDAFGTFDPGEVCARWEQDWSTETRDDDDEMVDEAASLCGLDG